MLQNSHDIQSDREKPGDDVCPDEILNLAVHIGYSYRHKRPTVGKTGKKVIKGIAVSPGIAVGPAVVVLTPEDLQRVTPGSILICPQMSPVYSIAFHIVRGIISERGSILSTTATVAREYDLPAVTGIQSALQIISDRDLIWMDGTNGHVQIISKAL